MGVAIGVSLLVVGAVLVIAVGSPAGGPNLQTAGLLLTLIALTILNVVMTLRDGPGPMSDRDDV